MRLYYSGNVKYTHHLTPDEKLSYLRFFQKFQQNREKAFAPSIFKAINNQYIDAVHLIKSGVSSPTIYISSQDVHKALKPLYMDAAVVYGARIRAQLNRQKARMPIGFNQRMIDLMTAYFQADILNVAEDITDTTRELIQRVLTQAIEGGHGIDWIVDKLRDTEISRTRSRRIARTETVTAANQGAMFAAQDSGLTLNKEWLATSDARTRHDHRMVNGQIIGFDDYFSLPENIKMAQPGARTQENGLPTPPKEVINCRCTVLFDPVR